MNSNTYDIKLNEWNQKELEATELGLLAVKLWFDRSIELMIFRRSLVDARGSEILNHHLYAQRFLDQPLTIDISLAMTKAISEMDIAPARIDLGRLGAEWLAEKEQYNSLNAFLDDKLKSLVGSDKLTLEPKDVVLYGFGRIGRIAARILINQSGKGQQLRLKAIVTRSNSDDDILKRASLLRKDSVHGKFHGTIVEDLVNKSLIINGVTVHMIAASDPSNIDYSDYGIDDALIIDNTGITRDREGLSKHMRSKGVDKILLTAPGKGDVPNIVYGVNHETFSPDSENIFSAASCTTNAVVPVISVIESKFGIHHGHIETVHSYTNDQNLLDNYHKKYRRGRSAPINMVITETGAAKAVSKVIPAMENKLTGNAIRVPTPNVSMAILNLTLNKTVTRDEINEVLRHASIEGPLTEQIDFSMSNELVSSDCVGNGHSVVVDAPATIVSVDGSSVVLYCWYDNEFGYTRQVVRLAKYVSKVRRLRYY